MKTSKSSTNHPQHSDQVKNEMNNRGIFGRMLGSRSGLSAESVVDDPLLNSRVVEQVLSDNEASLSVITDDLQAIAQLAQGFEAEQRSLSSSLAAQLQELKAVQASTQDYEQHLKNLLEGPIQMLEERVSNRVDLKTWYDEVSRIKSQLHNILTSVNDQHSQGAQLQRVCEAQEKRVMQLENQCRDLEQAFSQKRLGSDYSDQRMEQTAQQLREQQSQFEQSLRQLNAQRTADQRLLSDIQQQLQRMHTETEYLQSSVQQNNVQQPAKEEWQQLFNGCKAQILQVQKAQSSLQKNAVQIEAIASSALQQFSETQKSVSKMHAYRESVKESLRQFQQDYQKSTQQHQQKFEAKITAVDERMGHLDTLVQDTQQALSLANNARKVALKFNQDVDAKLQDIRQIDQSIQSSLQKSQQWANQFSAFEQRVSALVADLDEGKQEEHALLQELSGYRKTFDQHFQDWTQFKSWCQQLSENLVAAEGQLNQEKLVVSAYLAETEQLVKVVHQDSQQLSGQHNLIEQSLQQLKNLYQQVNGLLEQHQQGRQSVENLLASEKALNNELCAQSQQVSVTLQEMTSRLQAFDALSAQAKQDQGCVRALINSCQGLIATAKTQETQNSENIAKISEALQTFKTMQHSFTTITHQYGQMHQQAKALNQELVEGTQQLHALENKVDSSCNVLISLSEREQQRAEQMQGNLQQIQQLQQSVLSYHADNQDKLQVAEQLQLQAQLCLQQSEQLREQMQQVLLQTADTAMNVKVQSQHSDQTLKTGENIIQQQQKIQNEFQQQLKQLQTMQDECQQSLQQAKQANERSSRSQHTLDVDRQELQKSLADSEVLLLKNRQALDDLTLFQQQVMMSHEQVNRAEKQTHQLMEGVHSANQSAQQCIRDIHQVKQQAIDFLAHGEQLLNQSQQQQKAFESSIVTHEHWHHQYAQLAESAQRSVLQVIEFDAQLHEGLQQQQQVKDYIEQKCISLEQKFDENLSVSQKFQQRADLALSDVKAKIAEYRDVHMHSQSSLLKSEELHTKIAQLLESSKDHAHQVENMRRQIHTEVANLQMLAQQQNGLHAQLTPYVQRFQEMEQHFIKLGEQWSVQMQQAEVEQRQQQALNRRCQQLQTTTENLQVSLEAQLKTSQQVLQDNQQQLQATQTQLQESVQAHSLLQQDLSRYADLSDQLSAEQKRYRNLHQSLQEAHQQVTQQLNATQHTQASHDQAFVQWQQHSQTHDHRLLRLEQAMDQVTQMFKEFVSTHHESKNLNKETFLAAKEQKLLLKEMENEIKELKFALKVREKSPAGYVGRQYIERQVAQAAPLAPEVLMESVPEPTLVEHASDQPMQKPVSSQREWLADLAQLDVMEAPDDQRAPREQAGFKGFLFALALTAGLLLPMQGTQWPNSEATDTRSAPSLSAEPVHLTTVNTSWTWPIEVLDKKDVHYSDFRSGVYLHADLQASVRAAQQGIVVYTGADLTGLGQVIILQHPHELMTIYGNNVEKLVNKGDVVANGQVIARIGQIGEAAPTLYFEVRYQGQPEDPFLYFQTQVS